MVNNKPKCVFCTNDTLCGCHNNEPIYDTQDEHPQYDLSISDKEFEEILDEQDTE